MAEAVDGIYADLQVRYQQYVDGFDKATAAHERFTKSVPSKSGLGASFSTAEIDQYTNRHKKAAGDVAKAEVDATEKVSRTRKARVASAVASDEAEVRSAKKAADAKIAEAERVAEREARLDASARRRTIATYGDNPGMRRATGGRIGATVANEPHGQASIPAGVLSGAGDGAAVAEATEIDHLTRDLITLRANLVALAGREKQEAQDLAAEMMLQKRLLAEGVAEEEILVKLEERRVLIAAARAKEERATSGKGLAKGAEQFARGAGAYAAVGGAPAIAGLAITAAIATTISLTEKGLEYAQSLKAISDQLGITTTDLQKYQAVAATLGVTQDQLRESFSQLANNLGRAQEGSEQQSKIFSKLNIDIGNSKTGFKSLSDIMPTFLDRLSKIPDQAQRLAIETALGGEQLRRLDPVLSKGAGGFDQLANSISGTSAALSDREIKEAAATANKLKLIGDQLQRDLTKAVAANAGEIENLAKAFFKLADGALKAFSAYSRFKARAVLNDPDSTPQQRAQAISDTNSTHEGRVENLAHVNASLRALEDARGPGGASFGRIHVDAIGDIANTPAGRQAARLKLIAMGHEVQAAERADNAAAAPKPIQPGNPGDVSNLFSPKPPKGRKGKSADTLANEEEARDKRFKDQLAGFQEAQLRAEEDATGDIERRADIEKQLADRALKRQLDDIEAQRATNVRNGEDGKKAQTQADALASAARAAHDQEVINIDTGKQVQISQATTEHLETGLQIQSETLGYQLAIAKTAKQRRDLDLRLLDIAIQLEKIDLEKQRAALKKGDPRIADIDTKIAALPAKRDQQAAIIRQNDAGPLQAYLNGLPHTADQIREAFETAAVNGIEKLNDGLATTLENLTGIHGEAGEFLADLIKIGLQILENNAAQAAAPGGGGFAGFLSSVGSIFGGGGGGHGGSHAADAAAFSLPGFAGGGSALIGGRGGIDQNVLSINGEPKLRVGKGELLSVVPNVAASNRSAAQPSGGGITVLQPITVDARGAVMNDQFAQLILSQAGKQSAAISAAYSKGAVASTPGYLQQMQTLKG